MGVPVKETPLSFKNDLDFINAMISPIYLLNRLIRPSKFPASPAVDRRSHGYLGPNFAVQPLLDLLLGE